MRLINLILVLFLIAIATALGSIVEEDLDHEEESTTNSVEEFAESIGVGGVAGSVLSSGALYAAKVGAELASKPVISMLKSAAINGAAQYKGVALEAMAGAGAAAISSAVKSKAKSYNNSWFDFSGKNK